MRYTSVLIALAIAGYCLTSPTISASDTIKWSAPITAYPNPWRPTAPPPSYYNPWGGYSPYAYGWYGARGAYPGYYNQGWAQRGGQLPQYWNQGQSYYGYR